MCLWKRLFKSIKRKNLLIPGIQEVSAKEAYKMYYAYVKGNADSVKLTDNSMTFKLAQDVGISEEETYIDEAGSKEELLKLLDVIKESDHIIIRSVVDLSDEPKELLGILETMQNKQVILCSTLEPYLNGTGYYTAMRGFADINKYYLDRKRRQKFEEANRA